MKYMTVGNELEGASQLILGCMRLAEHDPKEVVSPGTEFSSSLSADCGMFIPTTILTFLRIISSARLKAA